MYSSHANTGCCSVECDRNSQYFDQIECSNICNRTSVSLSSYRTSSDPSLNQLPNLTYNSQFNTEVNLNESVIFVPINIFVKGKPQCTSTCAIAILIIIINNYYYYTCIFTIIFTYNY